VLPVHRFETWQVWLGSFSNPPADVNYPLIAIHPPKEKIMQYTAGDGTIIA
jgi:hypothetical protein